MARLMFMMIRGVARRVRIGQPVSLAAKERIVARIKFEAGPARAIRAESRLGCLKLKGSKGTGLPQPNLKSTSMIEPTGSRWAMGFKVTLPWREGVGSPSLSAIKAWANSWIVTAIIRLAAQTKKIIGLFKSSISIVIVKV